jgi:dipeptidyl aminopeptidase/acylaminoacyl peptidase
VLFRSILVSNNLAITVLCLISCQVKAQVKQPLTPEACTEIRYLAPGDFTSLPPLELSPDGYYVAYVIQVPNIASNDNNNELYVRSMNGASSGNQDPVLSDKLAAAPHWFPDNKHIAVLTRQSGKAVLTRVDITSKTRDVIWEADGDITDYSMDATGDTIVIAVKVDRPRLSLLDAARDSRKGFRLDILSTAHSSNPRRRVYILRRVDEHHWKLAKPVTFISPLSGQKLEDVVDSHDMHISISPDGHYLLMDNIENLSDVPQDGSWGKSLVVQYMKKRKAGGLIVSYLYDVTTGNVSMPLESPVVRYGQWAHDSKSYVEVALAPVMSTWENNDLKESAPNDHDTHLFSVDVRSGKISEVINRAEEAPVGWTRTGDIIVRNQEGTLVTLRNESDQWSKIDAAPIPFEAAAPYAPLVSDGKNAVMEYENASTAPQIVAFDLASRHSWIVAKLNPEVDGMLLPETEPISWTTSTGFKASGLLLLPPDYDPHRRYPLVIEDGSILYSGEFVCDSGASHVSSFARAILADAGIAYLVRYWPGINDWENNYYPKGYPGTLGEAAFKQDLVESVVKFLDQRQLIDPAEVGLVGFSRGGWYVEYTLTHSQTPFKAATATDNVLYSMGEYWYWNDENVSRNEEGLYGGPPYGNTLRNWLDYSISFNLDKIHTPLLMEVMGHGKSYKDPDQPPDNLAIHNEVFRGLSRINKPVEYYYYPNEQHQPVHPQARISSLQRNVDWFRFWLQGYERPNPDDPNQYKRWELMRTKEASSRDGDGSTSVDSEKRGESQ